MAALPPGNLPLAAVPPSRPQHGAADPAARHAPYRQCRCDTKLLSCVFSWVIYFCKMFPFFLFVQKFYFTTVQSEQSTEPDTVTTTTHWSCMTEEVSDEQRRDVFQEENRRIWVSLEGDSMNLWNKEAYVKDFRRTVQKQHGLLKKE